MHSKLSAHHVRSGVHTQRKYTTETVSPGQYVYKKFVDLHVQNQIGEF